MAYGCFMEDIELGSHLSIKAKYFWPKGDRSTVLYDLINKATLLLRPNFLVPELALLMRFHCTYMHFYFS